MPDREVTMSPAPKVNPWDLWAWKWFGGGNFGSSLFKPQQWLSAPAQDRPRWGTPSQPTGESKGVPMYSAPIGPEPAGTTKPSGLDWGKLFSMMGLDIAGMENLAPDQLGVMLQLLPYMVEMQKQKSQQVWQEQQQQKQWEIQQNIAAAKAAEQAFNQQFQQQYINSKKEMQQRDLAAQRASAIQGPNVYGEIGRAEQMAAQLAKGFEEARQNIMASTAPRDWVIREKARMAVNPYAGFDIQSPMQNAPATEGQFLGTIPQNPTIKYTGVPELPGDIRGFLQGGGREGFGTAVETPSPQAWRVATPDAQERLMGYLESIGGSEVGLLQQMKNMLPNNPTTGTRWSVARQR